MRDDEPTLHIEVSMKFPPLGFTVIAPGFAIPNAYTATIDDAALPYTVALDVRVDDGRPGVESVTLRRRDGDPAIAARTLRDLPLQRFLKASVLAAEHRVEQTKPGHSRLTPVTEGEAQAAARAASAAAGKRRRRTDPEKDVAEALRLYEEARRDPEERHAPTLYVAKKMGWSRATASRLLRKGREGAT